MDAHMLLHTVIDPAMDLLALRGIRSNVHADKLLVAIALQESGLKARRQYNMGPARGWWQFERIGVQGVMEHKATRDHCRWLSTTLVLPVNPADTHAMLECNDHLAACYARLLLLTDPRPLPVEREAAWDCYLFNWRPGKQHPSTWDAHWSLAGDVMEAYMMNLPTQPNGLLLDAPANDIQSTVARPRIV